MLLGVMDLQYFETSAMLESFSLKNFAYSEDLNAQKDSLILFEYNSANHTLLCINQTNGK